MTVSLKAYGGGSPRCKVLNMWSSERASMVLVLAMSNNSAPWMAVVHRTRSFSAYALLVSTFVAHVGKMYCVFVVFSRAKKHTYAG